MFGRSPFLNSTLDSTIKVSVPRTNEAHPICYSGAVHPHLQCGAYARTYEKRNESACHRDKCGIFDSFHHSTISLFNSYTKGRGVFHPRPLFCFLTLQPLRSLQPFPKPRPPLPLFGGFLYSCYSPRAFLFHR